MLYTILGFWEVLTENGFHCSFLNIMSLQYAKIQMVSEMEKKQSPHKISEKGIGDINIGPAFFLLHYWNLVKRLLWKDIWGGRHFCTQHTILTFSQLIFIIIRKPENHRFFENSLEMEVI